MTAPQLRSLLLCCSTWLAVSCWAHATHADQPLRIVAYNVECLAAPGSNGSRLQRYRWGLARHDHAERVASVIETLVPDILCLSEVTTKESLDYVVDILHEKGLTDYAGYHVENHDHFSGFDVAFLSRIKLDTVDGATIRSIHSPAKDMTWREPYAYTDDKGVDRNRTTSVDRNALIFATVAGHRLGLLGLHLKSDPSNTYANARRTAQAKIVRRIVKQEIVGRGYLPIVLGDLNDYDPDMPDRDAERSTKTKVIRMLKDIDPKAKGDELVSAAEKIRRVADRYTSHWDVNENGTADMGDVYTMIDYVLLPKSLVPYHRRTFVARSSDLKTSDHWPVVVDLILPAK